MSGTRAALLGWPLGHTLSPDIFAALSAETGEAVEYSVLETPPERLREEVARLRAERWSGFNVTIPHKEAVVPMVDELTPAARGVGAVNAVRLGREGLEGHNTDAAGFLEPLLERGLDPAGREAVVLGAGGAARAAAYALGRANVERVLIVNRDGARASLLAAAAARACPETAYRAGGRGDLPPEAWLWVNATPVGMEGFEDRSPLPDGWSIPEGAVAYDLVYRPARTRFLEAAATSGARTLGGSEMLVYQALFSWGFWTGSPGLKTILDLKRRILGRLACRFDS